MKKIIAIICNLVLVFTLCACESSSDDISNNSFVSDPVSNIINDDISSSGTTTSEQVDTDISNDVSSDTPSDTNSSTPVDEVSSNPIVEDTPTEDEKPQNEPINFVPNKIPAFNSDTGKADYENAAISYSNDIWYKGIRYATTGGKNNGTDCFAIVTVGDNDEYLDCIYVFDAKNNEQAKFNIYNDRIYYFKYMLNDARDYVLLNDFAICSVNLSGTDKRVEKKLDISFTHAMTGEPQYYLNSKYLFFDISNLFDGIYDVTYRYNIETNEIVKLDFKLGAHNTIYSVGERVFIWDYSNNKIVEYDVDLKNEQLFHKVDNPYAINSLVVSLQKDGFLLHHWEREDKYLLDFSGNRTQIS